MISETTEKFWKLYSALPAAIQKQTKIAYSQFKNNPYHPSLQFKRVHSSKPVYSVRINIDHRAIGIVDDAAIVWFWIGSHREYEKILQKL
uniref:ParE family toxin-like protein n=1 Tax=Candidatus Electronema sp. TaxID=2698783 RepID=UPI004055A5EE